MKYVVRLPVSGRGAAVAKLNSRGISGQILKTGDRFFVGLKSCSGFLRTETLSLVEHTPLSAVHVDGGLSLIHI